jgi:predicted Zn-dependent peptidase
VVTNAELAHTDVELERGVVLEEIAMRDDDPEDLLGELFDETLLAGHPLALPVIGSEESIRGMARDTLFDFWRGEYTAPRMVVAAAGNLEHEYVADLAAKALGDGPAASPVGPRRGGGVRLPARRALALRTDGSEQAHLMLGVPGLDRQDPRRPVLSVLNTALGGGLSSRLFQQVREQRGLAYQVYSSQVSYADAGTWSVYAGCAPERLGEVVGVVRDVLAAAAADGITEAEVVRAKGSLRGGMVLGLEDTASRMNRIGRSELDHGRQRTMQESLEKIAAVTPAEVAALAADLLSQDLTAAVVGPYGSSEDLPAALHDLA